MNSNTLEVMKKHLEASESYIEKLKKVESAENYCEIMKWFIAEVKGQYTELAEITEDYNASMFCDSPNPDLAGVGNRLSEVHTKEFHALMPKLGAYMGNPDVLRLMAEVDKVLFELPIFENRGVETSTMMTDLASGLAKTMTSSMESMNAKSTDISTIDTDNILMIITSCADSSEVFLNEFKSAKKVKAMVASIDKFVDMIKKLTPSMKNIAEDYKILTLRKAVPANISAQAKRMADTLGKDLKEAIHAQSELMAEEKVSRSVQKLGKILPNIPF